MAPEVKVLINPVSLRDGEWTSTGLSLMCCTLYVVMLYSGGQAWLIALQVLVFTVYTATDAPMYLSTPGPLGPRGYAPMGADGRALCLLYAVHQILSLSFSLHAYSHSQRSCRPQPRGGRREAAPRKDTRQDR